MNLPENGVFVNGSAVLTAEPLVLSPLARTSTPSTIIHN
uniref:Uncharacterized protein n=1 Tax=uncultured bacterium contig00062 TaxID=1181545 RepID=A0A806KJY5_9BACT|nr:hypothetical protein [uncultured bacterium contig00062]